MPAGRSSIARTLPLVAAVISLGCPRTDMPPEQALQSESPAERREAADDLRIHDREPSAGEVTSLLEAARVEPDPKALGAMLITLGASGDDRAKPFLCDRLADGRVDVARYARRGAVLWMVKHGIYDPDSRQAADVGEICDIRSGVARGAGCAMDEPAECKTRCDRGDATACQKLGALHVAGQGVAKDPVRAAFAFQRACEAGLAPSCGQLGWMFVSGTGVARDRARGVALLRHGCNGGSEFACAKLQELDDLDAGVPDAGAE